MVKVLNNKWINRNGISEYRQEMIKYIIDILDRNNNYTVLDCGCGSGLVLNYLPEEYKHRYYGIDFTPEMIEYCKTNYPEYKDHFMRVDLTGLNNEALDFMSDKALLITQNVLQHILLFQEALDNMFFSSGVALLLCERTHYKPTLIAGYDPAYRWIFNLKDFYDILSYYAERYCYDGCVEILSQPKTTFDEKNMVTIFKIERNIKTYSDIEYYNERYFKRYPLYNTKKKQKLTYHQRGINKIKSVFRELFFKKC
jgi:SAM-dependent methyltransferase